MRIGRIYKIACGHRLPLSGEEMFHGHNYTIEVVLEGNIKPETGLVIDCHDIDKIAHRIIKVIDHQSLNNVLGETPTVENLTQWLGKRLWVLFKALGLASLRLKVWETDRIFAEEEWGNNKV